MEFQVSNYLRNRSWLAIARLTALVYLILLLGIVAVSDGFFLDELLAAELLISFLSIFLVAYLTQHVIQAKLLANSKINKLTNLTIAIVFGLVTHVVINLLIAWTLHFLGIELEGIGLTLYIFIFSPGIAVMTLLISLQAIKNKLPANKTSNIETRDNLKRISLIPAVIFSFWCTFKWLEFIEETAEGSEGIPLSYLFGIPFTPAISIISILILYHSLKYIKSNWSQGLFWILLLCSIIASCLLIILFPPCLCLPFT